MPVIKLSTSIHAPIARCFDLSRSIDLHKISTAHTNEEAIDGVTSGLIGINETVTWRARHFGITQHLTTLITQYNRPAFFEDQMVSGAFQHLKHQHIFEEKNEHTHMLDEFDYSSPLGLIGKLVDAVILKQYLTGLLVKRNLIIKEFAESDKWKEVL
jgi:ligand-binding SRPBCC domain-containing protein